jgi:hypothetical protein
VSGRDFSLPDHLPQQRSSGEPASPEGLPRQRNGITPQMHGRYPDYNVLDERDHWDDVTRTVVLARVEDPPSIRFFTAQEALTLGAFCDVFMAQDRDPRVPVLNMVDAKLFDGKLDGYRRADMPDDRETWRRVAVGLDSAVLQHGAFESFAVAPSSVQHDIVDAFSRGDLRGVIWDSTPCAQAWAVVTRAVLSEFYSHPWAWNEIGFGGPAYPRGYARLGAGQRESWEGAPASGADPVREQPSP